MKGFFSNVSPRKAVSDLWQVIGAPSEYRTRSLIMAAAITGGIFYLMMQQEGRGLPRPPRIVYFESWRADRSDAEIIAGNIAATKKARAEEAEEERHAENIRQMYKAVGAATGLDTQKMYDEGKAEREAEKKAEDAKAKALLERYAAHPGETKSGQAPPDPAKPDQTAPGQK
ncbi:hypothetical protein OLX02_14050 [Novosphingobium sp. KCTC 2891]|uniref:hypothetical protein n=1 Tax=Novosphingobium sp. KCTC 2891 TaxID=2989730 RepID=UPI0022236029|nr:hypothetical protein [Novosphingobium sp. KCTC 2891]MCW1383941.1 hypothetical protein [Novosphingobium sp. KCTC 2891]